MNIKLTQHQIVGLMMEHIRANGKSKSGTYNKADPTHYERASAKFEMAYGYTMMKSNPSEVCTHTWSEPKCESCLPLNDEPASEVVEAKFHDCTWGVEFEFNTSIGTLQAYFDRDGKWIPRVPKGRSKKVVEKQFERVFMDMLFAEPEGTMEAEANAALMGKYYE